MDGIEFPTLELDFFYVQKETVVILLNKGGKSMELGFRKFNLEMASKMGKGGK